MPASGGKTVYEFWNSQRLPVNPFFKPLEDPRNGNLLKKSVYHAGGWLLQVDSCIYSILNRESYYVNVVVEDKYIGTDNCEILGLGGSYNPYMLVSEWRTEIYKYPSVKYWIELTKKIVKKNTASGPVTPVMISEEFTYNYNPANQSLRSISQKVKNNEYSITYFTYPQDYKYTGQNYPAKLVTKNIINAPIEVVKGIKKGNDIFITSGIANRYDDQGNIIEKLRLDIQNPLALSSFKFSNKSKSGILPDSKTDSTSYSLYSGYVSKETCNYTNGNPVYINEKDADKTVYLWGYNHQHPIAKIENATYAEVIIKISANSLSSIAAKATPTVSDLTAINNLRTQLPHALVTTYTYKPLVGITSVTDPRGVKTTYDYDAFGRLQSVREHNGQPVENYEYHYQN